MRARASAIKIQRRRARAVELRLDGLTYVKIAAKLAEEFGEDNLPTGYGELSAFKDVQKELQRQQKRTNELVDEIRRTELGRLDRMIETASGIAYPPEGVSVPAELKLAAIDRVVKLIAQRARLVPQLEQPVTVDAIQIRVVGGVDLDNV